MRKDGIVSAAFTAWGDTHFTDTSLARVADRLGVTKQALYRHLSGKEELLREMEHRFATDLADVIEEFEQAALSVDLADAVRRYVELLFRFFGEHPYYYLYLVLYLLRIPVRQGTTFLSVRTRHRKLLRAVLRNAGYAEGVETEMGVHFLSVTGFFWMAGCFWTVDGHRRDEEADEAHITARREIAVDLLLHGLFPPAASRPEFAAIEARDSIREAELPRRNRILSAIAEVVAADGFEQATVERIAERAGMRKSSLYFHFRNRAEMMASLLVPERDRLIELVNMRVSEYTEFASKLYAFMVTTATYAAQSRAILTALDWMRFHEIRIYLEDTRKNGPVYDFLAEPLGRDGYSRAGLSRIELAAYLHHLVIQPVLDGRIGPVSGTQNDFDGLRLLYQLVIGGLMGKESRR